MIDVTSHPLLNDACEMKLGDLLPHLQQRFAFESYWKGIRALKNPFDVWVYQEIMWDTKPDVIIEIGGYCGGAAIMLADLCTIMGRGRVICIDKEGWRLSEESKNDPRIDMVIAASEENSVFERIKAKIKPGERVMVIEDSAHDTPTCLKQLQLYSQLVTPGCYYIVEDTICYSGAGKNMDIGPFPGANLAVFQFMENNQDFERDRTRESFMITWCPNSFLKKKIPA